MSNPQDNPKTSTMAHRRSSTILEQIEVVNSRLARRNAWKRQHGVPDSDFDDQSDRLTAERARLVTELKASSDAGGHPVPNWENQSAASPRYATTANLAGVVPNTAAITGRIIDALTAHNVAPSEIDKFRLDMMSGDYYEALRIMDLWVTVTFEDAPAD